jgi:4-alpha-glucanotransferase
MNTCVPRKVQKRSAGILLHPTSLPGPYGIGDLGPTAHAWVDALVRARQTWWQMLPLGPTGYADSPYQSFSAFAGNPNLISPDLLIQDGLVSQADVAGASFPANHVDYERVRQFKTELTALAWRNFEAGASTALQPLFDGFCASQAHWLADFALFLALKEAHGGGSWMEWPEELIKRSPGELRRAQQSLAEQVRLHQFRQFLFFRQWRALKEYAKNQGVRMLGDAPIFIAADSVDVWTHPELFLLDARQRPRVVAGVPPDYFSKTGQLWGNPLYDWARHRATGYVWWLARLRGTLEMVDWVRLDHFRGFEANWEVPADSQTAETGRWVKGPGADLFEAAKRELGCLPLIAEDLGVITPEVETLRQHLGLPGMRILQFAFGGAQEDRFLPHCYERNTVVYTGTHDNDTTHGWYAGLTEAERGFLGRYAPSTDGDVSWDLIRLAWASVADTALAPLQDVLCLGSTARMNLPGIASGNWQWRFRADMLQPALLDRLADLTEVYDRAASR